MNDVAAGRYTDRSRRPDLRAVGYFVLLDLATYGILYWVVLPSFSEVLLALGSETAMAIGWVFSALRLGFLGLVVARAYRARRGLVDRAQIVPTMLTAASAAFALQLVLGLVARVMLNEAAPASAFLLDLVLWLGFPLVALLFVTPGEPERLPLRFRAMADRGATNLLLIPAVAGLVAATLIVVTVLGSATNDAREARTAADAAALGAAEAWRDQIGLAFHDAFSSADADDFWDFAGTDIGSLSSWRVAAAADRYARANGAELLAVDVDPVRARVSVRVRHVDRVPELGDRLESVASPSWTSVPVRAGRAARWATSSAERAGRRRPQRHRSRSRPRPRTRTIPTPRAPNRRRSHPRPSTLPRESRPSWSIPS